MNMKIKKEYEFWLSNVNSRETEILSKYSEEQIVDSFYKELSFGTGGIRGKMGLGTAKINKYVISRATRGLAAYLKDHYKVNRKIVIGFDTRNHSSDYAKLSSEILKNLGFDVYLFKKPLPTPCVSYAVRKLDACSGIVITASHNPKEYNGYKVYNHNGCQITTEAATEIFNQIKCLGYFDKKNDCGGTLNIIDSGIYESYIKSIMKEQICPVEDKSFGIIYTPLNGTGLKPVVDVLKMAGFQNIVLVKEQAYPDGDFPTCPKPNPEEYEAMSLGIEYARKYSSQLVFATDPDCDRLSIALKEGKEFKILSANELGCLLLNYICENIKFPKNPVFIKTIVTTDLAEMIARSYGVQTINTLTGFKFIGEQMDLLVKQGRQDDFIFGFEESCGFLKGMYVRDKDATVASLLVCEMYSNYKKKGISLIQKLKEIYDKYGYCLNTQKSFNFEGQAGQNKMIQIMDDLRYHIQKIGDYNIILKKDYLNGIDNLPKSNVIKIFLDNKSSIIFRPSGTEPKLKVYFSIFEKSDELAKQLEKKLLIEIEKIIK